MHHLKHLLALGLCALTTAGAWGDGLRNGIAAYQGSVQAQRFGELIDCTAYAQTTTFVLETQLTYVALPGVCDDLGNTACRGRVVARMERCLGGGNQALAAGSLNGGYSRSPFQICFEPDESIPAGCTGENVIAQGTWTGAGWASGLSGEPEADTELSGFAQLLISRSRAFQLDGRWVRVPPGAYGQHFAQERPDPSAASPAGNCAALTGPGCGIIGVGQH